MSRLLFYFILFLGGSNSNATPTDWNEFSKTLMVAARHSWLEDYKEEKLIKRISEIAEGDLEAADSKKLEKLVRSRVKAQRLRSMYFFLDESHAAPSDYNDFVIAFGKFKDSLASETKRKKRARQLLDLISDKSPIESTENFRSCSLSSFQTYVELRVKELSSLSAADSLSEKKYHELRKGFRDFLMFFQFYQVYQRDSRLQSLVERLHDINKKMGDTHDELIWTMMREHDDSTDSLSVPKSAAKAARELESVTNSIFLDNHLQDNLSSIQVQVTVKNTSGRMTCAMKSSEHKNF